MSKRKVGAIFREWRENNSHTLDDACDILSVSRSVIGQIEMGRSYPSAVTLARFCDSTLTDANKLISAILEADE